jgi:hypothetical protein
MGNQPVSSPDLKAKVVVAVLDFLDLSKEAEIAADTPTSPE